jgi:hypothetical protein
MMQGFPQNFTDGNARITKAVEGSLTVKSFGTYTNSIFRYPPSDLISNSYSVLNLTYGNGLYIVTNSAFYQNNDIYNGYNAFQTASTTGWYGQSNIYNTTTGNYQGTAMTMVGTTVYFGDWLQLEMPDSYLTSYYTILPRTDYLTSSPVSWYFLASINGIDWNILDTQTNYSFTSQTEITFNITGNTIGYKYYRISIIKSKSSGGSVGFLRFSLYAKGRNTITCQDDKVIVFDKLGIGLSNPASSLHVAGFSVLSGLKIISGNASNVIVPINPGGNITLSNQWTSISSNVFIIGSNIGIGKSNPIYPLDIIGDINYTGTFRQNGTAVSFGGGSSQWTSSGANIYITGSNVGIGTTNPLSTLYVNGNIQATGVFIAQQVLNAGPSVGVNGGGGDKIILWPGNTGSYPYSIGVNSDNTMWTSVPSGAVMKWYIGGTQVINLAANGCLGVGSNITPSYSLDVGTFRPYTTSGNMYYFANSTSSLTLSSGVNTYNNTAMRVQGDFIASGYIGSYSDKRIKTLQSYDATGDLTLIDSIDVIRYRYKDPLKGMGLRVGFIAQDIQKILPDQVSYDKTYIPDIFKVCDGVDEMCITLSNHGLSNDTNLRIFDEKNNQHDCIVTTILSQDQFKINSSIGNKLFVYGREVDDLHVLEHDSLFALAFSGVKQLHKKMKDQDKVIVDLKKDNDDLHEIINSLILRISNLENKNS